MTGVGLWAGFVGAGALALTGADVPALMSTIGASSIGPAAKFVVAFPLTYHYLGGLRHFVWDYFPDNLITNEKVEVSSYVLGGNCDCNQCRGRVDILLIVNTRVL